MPYYLSVKLTTGQFLKMLVCKFQDRIPEVIDEDLSAKNVSIVNQNNVLVKS